MTLCRQFLEEKVSSGQSVWAAITEYHRLGSLTNKHYSHSSAGEMSKVKVEVDSVHGGSPLPGVQTEPSPNIFTHQRELGSETLYVSSSRSTNPIVGALPHDLITSQRPLLQVPSHWGLGFQHVNFGGHKHLVHNILLLSLVNIILKVWKSPS